MAKFSYNKALCNKALLLLFWLWINHYLIGCGIDVEISNIVGAVAKEFFEKSKLHVHELSKIW